jgi:hypothetical protein
MIFKRKDINRDLYGKHIGLYLKEAMIFGDTVFTSIQYATHCKGYTELKVDSIETPIRLNDSDVFILKENKDGLLMGKTRDELFEELFQSEEYELYIQETEQKQLENE